MTWLDKIQNKQIQFKNKELESAVRNWIQYNKEEVFAGLIIRFGYISDICLGKITQVIPFPNNSSKPDREAYPNEEWFKIMKDIRHFASRLCRDYEVPFLGWLHSHPNGGDEFSEADFSFMGSLARSDYQWDGHIALLISWKPKRIYRYSARYVTVPKSLNESDIDEVEVRSWTYSPYLYAI